MVSKDLSLPKLSNRGSVACIIMSAFSIEGYSQYLYILAARKEKSEAGSAKLLSSKEKLGLRNTAAELNLRASFAARGNPKSEPIIQLAFRP